LASKGLSFGKKKDEDCGEESGGHRSFDLQEIEKVGYSQERHIRLDGEEFHLISKPFPDGKWLCGRRHRA